MLFSGVIPRNVIPERHKIFRAALALGAKVHKHLVTSGDDKTTHVVAARLGTEKVLHAQRLDLYIIGVVHNVRRMIRACGWTGTVIREGGGILLMGECFISIIAFLLQEGNSRGDSSLAMELFRAMGTCRRKSF